MSRQDDCPASRVEFFQKHPHLAPELDIHTRRRLIENEQLRFMDESARDHQSTFHPAGEHTRRRIPFFPQPQLLQIFLRSWQSHRARNPIIPRLIHHDTLHFLEDAEIEFLGNDADARSGLTSIHIQIVPQHFHSSACFVDQADNDADNGRFAGAIRTQETEKFPLRHHQIDPLERHHAIGIDFFQLFY